VLNPDAELSPAGAAQGLLSTLSTLRASIQWAEADAGLTDDCQMRVCSRNMCKAKCKRPNPDGLVDVLKGCSVLPTSPAEPPVKLTEYTS